MGKNKREKSPSDSKDQTEMDKVADDSSDNSDPNLDLDDTDNQSELPVEVREVLEKLPKKAQETYHQIVSVTSRTRFSAPIPPPDYIAKYERIRPGSADDTFAMARKEQEIRETAIKGQLRNEGFTISIAFVGVVGLVVVTGITAALGQIVVPLITGLSAMAVLAVKAVVGIYKRK